MIAAAARTAVVGSSAVQILLMLGGITLVPALLFTVTGFSRILIVLGFIRSGLGTPTTPPNQVLVGIALFCGQIHDGDVRALARIEHRHRTSDPGVAARNERDASFQFL